jgi:hypothetical protein
VFSTPPSGVRLVAMTLDAIRCVDVHD